MTLETTIRLLVDNHPNHINCCVRVDILEMQINTRDSECFVEAKFGGTTERTRTVKCREDERSNTNQNYKYFKFKGRKTEIKEISTVMPVDRTQIPDIFLNIFSEKFLRGTRRIGYVRIKASASEIDRRSPQWYQIKNPMDHSLGNSTGMVLADVRLLTGKSTKNPRANQPILDNVKVKIFCFIYGCYELEPELESEQVKARVEINFSHISSEQKVGENGELCEDHASVNSVDFTKNPIFGAEKQGAFLIKSTTILGSIDLASNFRVDVRNLNSVTKSGQFFEQKNQLIGSIIMHPTDPRRFTKLRDDSDLSENLEPRFYTIKQGGKIKGKLLAFFAYCMNTKNQVSNDKFKSVFELTPSKFNFDLAVVGLRNLDTANETPEVILKIPSYGWSIRFVPNIEKFKDLKVKVEEQERRRLAALNSSRQDHSHQGGLRSARGSFRGQTAAMGEGMLASEQNLMLDEEENLRLKIGDKMEHIKFYDSSCLTQAVRSSLHQFNPNLCTTIHIAGITLPTKALYWPRAEITIINHTSNFLSNRQEKLFTTVNLLECAPEYVQASQIKSFQQLLGTKKKEKSAQLTSFAGNARRDGGQEGFDWRIEKARTRIFRQSARGKIWQKMGRQAHTALARHQNRAQRNEMVEQIYDGPDSEENSHNEEGFDNPRQYQFAHQNYQNAANLAASLAHPNSALPNSMKVGPTDMLSALNEENQLNIDKTRIENVYFEELEPLNMLGDAVPCATDAGLYNGFKIKCDVIQKKKELNERKAEIMKIKEKIKELKRQNIYDEDILSKMNYFLTFLHFPSISAFSPFFCHFCDFSNFFLLFSNFG